MSVFLLVLVYFGLCVLSMSLREAILMTSIVAISLIGVIKLTRSNSILRSFEWFVVFKYRGLLVIILTASVLIMSFVYRIGPAAAVLLQTILAFLWFWLFAAIATYFNGQK